MHNGLAHHGYTVEFGTFWGPCVGSQEKPVQQERTLTDKHVKALGEYAVQCDENAKALKAGTWHPNSVKVGEKLDRTTYKYIPIYESWDKVTPEQQAKAVEIAIWEQEGFARQARGMAKGLKKLADELHGTELVLIVDAPKIEKPKAIVDVKAAKVYGAFGSKAARKRELDKLSRAFDKAKRQLKDLFLAIPHDKRTPAQDEVYWGPMDLYQWKPKHSAKALEAFPESAQIVATIEELVKAREAIKAAP